MIVLKWKRASGNDCVGTKQKLTDSEGYGAMEWKTSQDEFVKLGMKKFM